jgi:hypothetical protein
MGTTSPQRPGTKTYPAEIYRINGGSTQRRRFSDIKLPDMFEFQIAKRQSRALPSMNQGQSILTEYSLDPNRLKRKARTGSLVSFSTIQSNAVLPLNDKFGLSQEYRKVN